MLVDSTTRLAIYTSKNLTTMIDVQYKGQLIPWGQSYMHKTFFCRQKHLCKWLHGGSCYYAYIDIFHNISLKQHAILLVYVYKISILYMFTIQTSGENSSGLRWQNGCPFVALYMIFRLYFNFKFFVTWTYTSIHIISNVIRLQILQTLVHLCLIFSMKLYLLLIKYDQNMW